MLGLCGGVLCWMLVGGLMCWVLLCIVCSIEFICIMNLCSICWLRLVLGFVLLKMRMCLLGI